MMLSLPPFYTFPRTYPSLSRHSNKYAFPRETNREIIFIIRCSILQHLRLSLSNSTTRNNATGPFTGEKPLLIFGELALN